MSESCEQEVIQQLIDLQRRTYEYMHRDGYIAEDEFFSAEQNARLVKNAEEYYRSMFRGRVSTWNLRDHHMAETLHALSAHLERRFGAGKIVVWAHNSHLGDARAAEIGKRGEWNVGQLVRERYPHKSFLVGFTTNAGDRLRIPRHIEKTTRNARQSPFCGLRGARKNVNEFLIHDTMATGNDLLERSVQIPPSGVIGDLTIPTDAAGVVIFAHGSGSSRFSSRNRFVAGVLQRAKIATLLLDLLTTEEEEIDLQTRHLRFDIDLLANRLLEATKWLNNDSEAGGLPLGYFGASTGAAGALMAAAQLPDMVRAVVSRGGRPDLAGTALPNVQSPTLLVVGGADTTVIELNKKALHKLRCEKRLEIVPGATHLFEEPGTIEQVATLASHWFENYLSRKEERQR
jgi:putative phosphoribosyl transferase